VIANSDPNNYKFTGKERDAESNLDYFGARHYGSSLGRFMQTDPKQFSIRTLANPQKWNKYTYVQNSPLMRIDPDGMDDWIVFRPVTLGMHSKEWTAAEKSITSTKDSKGRTNTFHMVEGGAATVKAYDKAIGTPDTHVVFVGHSVEHTDKSTYGAMLSNGYSTGKNGSDIVSNGKVAEHTESNTVAASSVAIFSCDSHSLSSQYGNSQFVGTNSGPDGTSLGALDASGAAFVNAGGGQAGVDAANAAIKNSNLPIDKGDSVSLMPPKEPEKKPFTSEK
jgi:RHS repeat-associated protein